MRTRIRVFIIMGVVAALGLGSAVAYAQGNGTAATTQSGTVGVSAAAGASAASAAQQRCMSVVNSFRPVYAPRNWDVRCISNSTYHRKYPKTARINVGMADPNDQAIYVKYGLDPMVIKYIMGHEWAHAEQMTTWNSQAKANWNRLIRRPKTAAYFDSHKNGAMDDPAEIWARSRSMCAGFYAGMSLIPGETFVSCAIVQRQVDQAKYLRAKYGNLGIDIL